jgi:Tol biopolymer transport system component
MLAGLVSAALLSACAGLSRNTAPQPALSPTRTPSTQPSATSAARAPAQAPTAVTQATRSSETAEATATPRTRASALNSCSNTQLESVAATPNLLTSAGQIVFLTTDGNIALTDLLGRVRADVTTDAFVNENDRALRVYQYPTFSNDGTAVAFVSLNLAGTPTVVTQTVHVARATAGATLTDLYSTNDFNIPYLDWSPDSRQIAFLTINQGDGAIRVVGKDGGTVAIFDSGTPTYWHWRSDSTAMVTHLGGRARTAADDASISVIEAKGSTPGAQTKLAALPGAFQSPHYSPDGRLMLYVANSGNADELVLADASGKPICALKTVDEGAYFAWSPNGRLIGVMDTPSPLQRPAPLEIYDLSTGKGKSVHDAATTFFWSPDGEYLAVYSIVFDATLTPLAKAPGKLNSPAAQSASAALRLEIINAVTGNVIKVADTYPSREFIQYFQFFDQYSRAVTPWSPDGKHLVFSSVSPQKGTTDVAVATFNATNTGVDIKRIAAGTLAFWSPR